MALSSARGLVEAEELAASCELLAGDLLDALGQPR
jgi:hypothetical protein